MKRVFTARFRKSYARAPERIRRAFRKQANLLVRNLQYPSLHTKKYDEVRDIWQARADGGWRFYFRIEKDTYIFLDIMAHPK